MEIPHAPQEQLDWEKTCHRAITSDAVWKLDAYRASLFMAHPSSEDCAALRRVRGLNEVCEQLSGASGSISANLAEGYGRGTRVDRLRFLGYSLGSVRECMTWYTAATPVLGRDVVNARFDLIMRVRPLVLGLIGTIRRSGDGRSPFQW